MENDNNYHNLLIAKKTEKLITAIYLISQFLKDTENIKIEIRNEANKFLKNINILIFNDDENIFDLYKKALNSITLLISYLTIAKDTNLISKMNCSIIIEALRILENILVKKQFVFSKNDILILEEENLLSFSNEKQIQTINKNTSFDILSERNSKFNFNDLDLSFKDKKNQKIEKEEKSINDKNHKGQIIKDIKKDKSLELENKYIKPIILNNNTNKAKQNKDRKDNRRDQILGLFSRGVEVSINDISKKIIGCSIKTIQRELNDLVIENKLKKIGEKRWSKYILNN